MRQYALLAAAFVTTAALNPVFSQDQSPRPGIGNAVLKAQPAQETPQKGRNQVAAGSEQRQVSPEQSADEQAIRKTAESYAKSFSEGNSKAVASHFMPEAEYVDDDGTVFHGRRAIEMLMDEFFTGHPGSKLTLNVESIRFLSPNIAIEDGTATVTFAKGIDPVLTSYTAVHVKTADKWMTASVREQTANSGHQHRDQLKQLSWMLGEWVHEGDGALVRFSCHPIDNGNFLIRNFTVQMSGRETMSGSQRIGWDARSGVFRAWIFDSDGGFGEGHWYCDGNDWVLKLVGVTPDGQSASCTSIYSFVDAQTMRFRSVDHEVAGIKLPDSEPVTIVRQSPQPEKSE